MSDLNNNNNNGRAAINNVKYSSVPNSPEEAGGAKSENFNLIIDDSPTSPSDQK